MKIKKLTLDNYLPMIKSIINKHYARLSNDNAYSYEDLISEGTVMFYELRKKYIPLMGNFSTYFYTSFDLYLKRIYTEIRGIEEEIENIPTLSAQINILHSFPKKWQPYVQKLFSNSDLLFEKMKNRETKLARPFLKKLLNLRDGEYNHFRKTVNKVLQEI